MILHNDIGFFTDTIRAASVALNISPIYIEKDYWITMALRHLSESRHVDYTVFKGGTSLSKGFRMINRFSEDVDIAIVGAEQSSGNQIKNLIREVEKSMTQELTEVDIAGVTSKGTRFRKAVYEYPVALGSQNSNKLIVEINSFANPYPFGKLVIKSFITEFLEQIGKTDYIQDYNLQSFELNVLDKRQTLLEKLVSLIRFSYEADPIQGMASKIRHFYDLYYLLADAECLDYVESSKFKIDFYNTLQHDKETFDIPKGWTGKKVNDSILVSDFHGVWMQVRDVYTKELAMLAFTEIPPEKEIAQRFEKLIRLLLKYCLMPPRKQIHIYAKETAIYPAIVEYLQHHPLFADCDFNTLEMRAFVKKAPPYIRDIDTPIANLERYARNNAHLIEYYKDEQLILKKDLARMMKISRPTLDKWIEAGFIKRGSSKYLNMELYRIDSVIQQLRNQKNKK